jgi:hypothetical protein
MATDLETTDPNAAAAPADGNLSVDQLAQSFSRKRRSGAAASGKAGDPSAQVDSSAAGREQPAADPDPGAVPSRSSVTGDPGSNPIAPGQDGPEGDAVSPEDGEAVTPPEDDTDDSQESDGSDTEDTGEAGDAEGEEALPKGVRKLQRRVDTLTKRLADEREAREDAERLLREARQSGKQSTQAPGKPSSAVAVGDRFAAHPEVREVSEQLEQVEAVLTWAESHPDGDEVEVEGQLRSFSAEQVGKIRRDSLRKQIQLETRRESRLADLAKQDQQIRLQSRDAALKTFPWMTTKTSPEYQEAVEIIRQNPSVQYFPEWPMLIGDLIEGRRARLAKAKAAAAKPRKPAQTPTPMATGSATAPPRSDPMSAELKAAKEQFDQTGSTEDLKSLLTAQRRARQKAA